VVFVSGMKDLFEDMKRHKSDDVENKRITRQGKVNTHTFK